MDANNVIFILSDGEQRYRAGDFFHEVLTVMLGRSENLVSSAYVLWGQADKSNRRKLDIVCPLWFGPLAMGWRGEISEDDVRAVLGCELDRLPELLAEAFPECVAAIEAGRAEWAALQPTQAAA